MRNADDAIELRATGMFVANKSHKGGKGDKGPKSATVRMGPGPGGTVIEARDADGSVARVEMPAVPAPPAPPEY